MDNSKQMAVPGPGSYQVSGVLGKKYDTSVGKGFGNSKRNFNPNSKSHSEIPGPGQYTIDSYNPNGVPRYGFGSSTRKVGGIS